MARWKNGQIPYSELVKFGSGPDSITGTWEWWLSPATLQRWHDLVAYCQAHYNWTPKITAGWNAYRPLAAQTKYKAHYVAIGKPLQAATPGTSSHGGNYGNRDSLALDVGNWAEIGWAKFAAACKAKGWSTNIVVPQELWHIVDFNPWALPATAGTEIDMTPEQAGQLNSIFQAVFNGGNSMKDGGRSISQSLAEIASGARPTVLRGGKNITWLQELADAKTGVIATNATLATGVSINADQVKQIADAISAQIKIPSTVTIDYNAIAAAVNNDAAKRMTQ